METAPIFPMLPVLRQNVIFLNRMSAVLRANFLLTPPSLGPCPGRLFALVEITLVVARVLWELDMQVAAGSKDEDLGGGTPGLLGGRGRFQEYQLWTGLIALSQGPILQFKRAARHPN